jgi:acetyltransferase-like isoleucine patch superfamily enzyme
VIEAAQIGSGVEIGDNCAIVRLLSPLSPMSFVPVLNPVSFRFESCSSASNNTSSLAALQADYQGKFVIIKDLAVILPDTVLPEGTVVPSFSVWSGNPGTSLPSPFIIHLDISYSRL